MNQRKNGFIMYKDWGNLFSVLTLKQKGELLEAIFEFQLKGKIHNFGRDNVLEGVFNFCLGSFIRDAEKYEELREKNRENGKKSHKSSQNERSVSNGNLNDNDKDNDKDNVKDKDKDKENVMGNVKPNDIAHDIEKEKEKVKENDTPFAFVNNKQLANKLNRLASNL